MPATETARDVLPALLARTGELPAFYRYPSRRVVAVVADDVALRGVLAGLDGAGVDLGGVHVMSGEDGRRRLARDGRGHGLLARMERRLIAALTSDAGDVVGRLDTALRLGAHLVAVPTRRDDDVDATAVLLAHDAHHVVRFTRWGVDCSAALR